MESVKEMIRAYLQTMMGDLYPGLQIGVAVSGVDLYPRRLVIHVNVNVIIDADVAESEEK